MTECPDCEKNTVVKTGTGFWCLKCNNKWALNPQGEKWAPNWKKIE
ncbi:MAG: hypothetical protein JXA99_08635 [Candidatus Lokiarchaeota archaeon]|nr:hypothetical protein [Candidatus Lokiarchaeota archaeon]